MTALTGDDIRTLREDLLAPGGSLDDVIEASRASRRRRDDPAYSRRLAEFATFLADVLDGRRDAYWLRETMSTSDFPILMGDVLDRAVLARYRSWPTTWTTYAKRGTVRDFRTVRRIALDGLEGRYRPTYLKPELADAREDNALTETAYSYNVEVYEKAVALNWRQLVNDDLDAFRDIPDRLAVGARRTEEFLVTELFVDANGPHASFYTAGNGNIVTGNPPLSISGLQTAMTVLGNLRDATGEPIAVDMVTLVIPPALEVVANNIVNATVARVSAGAQGGATGVELEVANWMSRKVRVVVNPYIPVVASAANGNTSWFLFANPDVSRPALEIGFLRGYEEPGLYQQAPNTMRVGGAVEPLLGDFDSMTIRYKGMHIIGGTRLDPKATVASNGSGS